MANHQVNNDDTTFVYTTILSPLAGPRQLGPYLAFNATGLVQTYDYCDQSMADYDSFTRRVGQ